MPEIGATLREARMRQRLDISDFEAQTKIRAKYLRALENEEWELLPGPTFVKTFLRTYAEALGLDARLMLEEYKLRYERVSEYELQPIAPQTSRDRQRQQKRRGGGVVRDVLVAVLVVGLVGVLILLGRGGDDDSPSGSNSVGTTPGTSSATPPSETNGRTTTTKTTGAPKPRTQASVRLTATGPVYVCLKAGDKVLIREQTLNTSTPAKTYRAKSFRLLLGNGSLTMQVNGKKLTVPESAEPIAYSITTKGRTKITADSSAICS